MQNIVILAGNIGQSPEVRTTQGGTKITNFTLATSRPRLSEGRVQRDENGYRVMDTEWHRITCFNGLGKTVADNCEKGMKVMVHGRIHYTKWTDAAGVDRYGCEIIAEKVDFLSASDPAQKPVWKQAAAKPRRAKPNQARLNSDKTNAFFARRLLGVYQTVLRSPVWLNS
jgi:single-strand DNA-binding protein